MSFFTAMASGFVGELNTMAKERAAAERENEIRAEDFNNKKELVRLQADLNTESTKEQLKIQQENWVKQFDAAKDAKEIAGLRTMFGNLDDDLQVAILSKATTEFKQKLFGGDVFGGVNDMSSLASTIASASQDILSYGSGDNRFEVPIQKVLGTKPDDPIAVASTTFNTWESFLSASPENYNSALQYFRREGNDDIRKRLQGQIVDATDTLKNNLDVSAGEAKLQESGYELAPLNISGKYPSAARLFDELGFRTDLVEDVILPAAAEQVKLKDQVEYNPETEDLRFIYTQSATELEPSFVAIKLSNEQIAAGEKLAKATGHKDLQNMLLRNSFRTQEGVGMMTPQAHARLQNRRMLAAIEMEELGYGAIFRDPTLRRTRPDLVAEFFQYTQDKFAGDEQGAIQAFSILYGTPNEYFKRKPSTRYGTPSNYQLTPGLSGDEFAAEITGVEKSVFMEGYEATLDSLTMLDELMSLEENLSENIGTGFVRDFFAGLERGKVQIQQVGGNIKTFFTGNTSGEKALFGNTTADTDIGDLQAVVEKLNAEGSIRMDLANLSAADSLRLALAARMARAIDPAGRLSNQDFEIQLRRLGKTSLATPEDIQASLRQVKADFERGLATKHLLADLYNDKQILTEASAKQAIAYMGYRSLQRQHFGAEGEITTVGGVGADSGTLPEGFIKAPETAALTSVSGSSGEGQPGVTYSYFPSSEGVEMGWYVVNPEDNTMRPITDAEVKTIETILQEQ
jgi:hypothetical protein